MVEMLYEWFKVISAVIVGGNGQSIAALLMSDGQLLCYDCHGGTMVQTLSIANHNKTDSIKAEYATCSRSHDPRLLFHSGTSRIEKKKEKETMTVNRMFKSDLNCSWFCYANLDAALRRETAAGYWNTRHQFLHDDASDVLRRQRPR